jgi:hypothetical protein
MSIKLNRKVWKTVEAITLRLLNDSCRFPGAKRFVITGTVPGKTITKNAIDGINIQFPHAMSMVDVPCR